MNELNELFKQLAEAKAQDPKQKELQKLKEEIHESVKGDLSSLFAELASLKKKPKEVKNEEVKIEPAVEPITEELQPLIEVPVVPVIKQDIPVGVDKYLTDKSFQQPNPDRVDPSIKAIQDKLKFVEQWLGKIAATGPGGGEVNLRYLDDVKRDTIADGRWLKYSEADKKFVFDEINPYEVVYNTTLVTTATYTVQNTDWYIGVNRAGPVTITLPTSPSSGRVLVIKDESGNASANPITVVGTVDNDAGGFILQMDNGGIQMVYRSGWRVI